MKLNAVDDSVRRLKTAPPVKAGRLTIIPLVGPSTEEPSYVLYGPATEEEVEIQEVSEAGAVPKLRISNKGAARVFVLDSAHLLGMKQNRILNKDVLVPAESDIVASVSCVESGRWSRSDKAKACYAGIAPLSVRSRKARSMSRALKARGRAEADQGEVWMAVDDVLDSTRSPSPSAALSDAYDLHHEKMEEARERFSLPEGTVGVVALRDGCFEGLDLFDRASTLKARWDDLARSYLLEALIDSNGESEPPPGETVESILSAVTALEWTCADSDGEGEDIRAENETVVAGGLLFEGQRVLHLQAYPAGKPESEAEAEAESEAQVLQMQAAARARPRRVIPQVQGAPAGTRCVSCGFMYATVRTEGGVYCNHCGRLEE